MRTYYILKKVQQRRNVYGNFLIEYYLNKNKMKYIFRVKDLKGLTSGGSFFIEITEKKRADFARALSIPFATKNTLDHLKSQMDVALLIETETFLNYATT